MKNAPPCDQGIYTIAYPGYYEAPDQQQRAEDDEVEGVYLSEEVIASCEEVSSNHSMESRKWGWLVDVLSAATVVVFLAVVEVGFIPNTIAGFYCEDPKISHKFNGDTISITSLLLVTITLPPIILWLVEFCNCSHNDYTTQKQGMLGLRLMWCWYREYLVGLTANIFITETAKLLVGEPRPHFLDTCRPDLAYNCTPGEFIPIYTCTGSPQPAYLLKDCTRSFPSGHASMSVHTAIFMFWFFQRRISRSWSYLLVPCLQCLCMVWAMGCSFTRITDHRHHWWDVLAGSVLGVVTAVFTIKMFCTSFVLSAKITSKLPPCANIVGGFKENGHAKNSDRHQSVRRLLTSNSSCSGSISHDDKELSEVPMS